MWMDNWVLNLPVKLWPKYTPEQIPFLFRFFETKRNVVVLSSSNRPEIEVNQEACLNADVPILQRKGGGGTVVLGPGCLVLTFAFYAKDIFGNKEYFRMINELWIKALQDVGYENFSQQGISDICYGEKKIAGTSIFRKKHLLVYQGSLLVDPDLKLIHQLLLHPSREPAYRKGRSHQDFLTNLKEINPHVSASLLAIHCQNYFARHVGDFFNGQAISPCIPVFSS